MTTPTPRNHDPPHAREEYVPVPGARLYLRELGSGPPLLVLHGGPDFNHRYLLPELDRLASVSRLIYYDQRGRGRSASGVVAEDVGIESDVDDIDRVRQHLGLDAVSLLGHSWGGLLAMEYATRHPDHVSRLVLLNTAPASYADRGIFGEQRRKAEQENLASMDLIAATPEYAEGDIETEAEYYRAHFATTVRRRDLLERVVGSLRTDFTPATILQARAIEERLCEQTWRRPDYDLLAGLRALKTPTLVIHGSHDFVPLECATHIAEAMPGARLVVLECGHFAFIERPAEVLDAIAAFFSRC